MWYLLTISTGAEFLPSTVGDLTSNLIHVQSVKDKRSIEPMALFDFPSGNDDISHPSSQTIFQEGHLGFQVGKIFLRFFPPPKMPPAERLSTATLKAGFSLTVPKRKTSAAWCVMPRRGKKIWLTKMLRWFLDPFAALKNGCVLQSST